MKRRLLASLAMGATVAVAALACSLGPALAQDRGGSGQGSTESKRDDSQEANQTSERIERALRSYQTYRERTGPNLEQTRKEIDRLRDDLEEVTKLRVDMAISLAEMRSELASAMAHSGGVEMAGFASPYPGAPGMAAGFSPGNPGEAVPRPNPKDRDMLRREVMHRELKQVQDQLRAEVEQAQAQTDQIAAQLRELRARQRQISEQSKARHERSRSGRAQDQNDRDRDRDQDNDRDQDKSSGSQPSLRSPENASERNR